MTIKPWKLWTIAAVLAGLTACLVSVMGRGDLAEAQISDMPLVGLVYGLLPEAWRAPVSEFIVTRPGFSSFAPLVLVFRALLLIPMVQRTLARIWPDAPGYLLTQLETDKAEDISAYFLGQPFHGRDKDLECLKDFGSDKEAGGYYWMAVSGRMGRGKTRLALEWLKSLQSEGWDAGVWHTDERLGVEAVKSWRLRKPTAIVIDEAGSLPTLWPVVIALIRQGIRYEKPVRVLLVDQTVPREPEDLPAKDIKLISDKKQNTLRLAALDTDAADTLGAASGMTAQDIKAAEGRPLLLRLGPDWQGELAARAERRLGLATTNEAKTLLAFACLAGPIPVESLPDNLKEVGLSIRQRLFEGESRKYLRHTLPALRPEALAQDILLRWAQDQQTDQVEVLVGAAIDTARFQARRALGRLAAREAVPERLKGVQCRIVDMRPEGWPEDALQDIKSLSDQQHKLGEAGDIDTMMDVYESINELAEKWSNHEEVKLEWMSALTCKCQHLGQRKHFADLDSALTVFPINLDQKADNATATAIAFLFANALRHAVLYTAKDIKHPGRWERTETYLERLRKLSEVSAYIEPDLRIKSLYATALGDVLIHTVIDEHRSERWTYIEGYLSSLINLSTISTDSDDEINIAIQCARSLSNAMSHGNKTDMGLSHPDWRDFVTRNLQILNELIVNPDFITIRPKLALNYATALVNLVIFAPQDDDINSDVWNKLALLSRQWSTDTSIQNFLSERIPQITFVAQQEAGFPWGEDI